MCFVRMGHLFCAVANHTLTAGRMGPFGLLRTGAGACVAGLPEGKVR